MSTSPKGQASNFLIVVADDLGYSDLGCFGSEIHTPNLDRLAREGVRMETFYCAPFCSPSRAMLHTGLDAHLVGFGALKEVMDPRQAGKPGYEMYLNSCAPTLAERLKQKGYRNYLAGKWHLGRDHGQGPHARGFDRSYGLMDGSASHFAATATWSNDPRQLPKALFMEDDQPVALPESEFYSSQAYADRMIGYLRAHPFEDSPFFACLNFTAPHFPLHAPDEYIARYRGRYDEGYETIRQQRHRQQQTLGMKVPAELPPLSPVWPAWESLSPELRALEARHMEVYAAMIECMDHHLGRVFKTLEELGKLEDTLIIFMSDNGAEGNSVLDTARTRDWVRQQMDNSLENRGRPGSFIEQGPGWAQVSNTPLRMYKSFTYEVGIRVPFIARHPRIANPGQMLSGFAHVTDIVPTVLDLAGLSHEAKFWPTPVPALHGRSMVPAWSGQAVSVHSDVKCTGWEMQGRKALRTGPWKLVWSNRPWGSGQWELFDLSTDPAETRNLAAIEKDRVSQMLRAWDAYVVDNGVIQAEGMAEDLLYSNACRYYEDLAFATRELAS